MSHLALYNRAILGGLYDKALGILRSEERYFSKNALMKAWWIGKSNPRIMNFLANESIHRNLFKIDMKGSLRQACIFGNPEMVREMIRSGVDSEWRSQGLWDASRCGNKKVVDILLAHGIPRRLVHSPYNALFVASRNNHSDVVKTLLLKFCGFGEGCFLSQICHNQAQNIKLMIKMRSGKWRLSDAIQVADRFDRPIVKRMLLTIDK